MKAVCLVLSLLAVPSFADDVKRASFPICNQMGYPIEVAIAVRSPGREQVFASGWWAVPTGGCVWPKHESFHAHLEFFIAMSSHLGVSDLRGIRNKQVSGCIVRGRRFDTLKATTCGNNAGEELLKFGLFDETRGTTIQP